MGYYTLWSGMGWEFLYTDGVGIQGWLDGHDRDLVSSRSFNDRGRI